MRAAVMREVVPITVIASPLKWSKLAVVATGCAATSEAGRRNASVKTTLSGLSHDHPRVSRFEYLTFRSCCNATAPAYQPILRTVSGGRRQSEH